LIPSADAKSKGGMGQQAIRDHRLATAKSSKGIVFGAD